MSVKWGLRAKSIASTAALAVVATSLVVLPAQEAAAVTVPLGTVEGQMSDNVGTNASGSSNVTAGNCLTYAPTNGDGRTGPTNWVTSTQEAQAGHSGTNRTECPTSGVNINTQSVIGFRPTSLTQATSGTPFLLGQMTHYNNPITSDSRYFKGNLNLRFGGQSFAFPYLLDETPNNVTPPEDTRNNDRLTFTTQISGTITIGTFTFRLVANGFVQNLPDADPALPGVQCPATIPTGSTADNTFSTVERSETQGCLYGELTQKRALTLVKQAVSAGGAPATMPAFNFTSNSNLEGSPWKTNPGALTPPSTTPGNNTASSGPKELLVPAETVTIVEAAPPTDWALTSVQCLDGTTVLPPANVVVNLTTRTLTLQGVPESTTANPPPIVCTFTNTYTPPSNTLRLEKVWGANSVANDTAALTIAGGVTNPATATSIAPAAPGAGNTASTQARSGAGITVSEQLGGVGSYTSTLRCVRTGTTTEVTGSSDGTFPMPNYPVTCTYTNTRTANELKLEKVWGANSVANDTAALTIAGGVTNPATATSIAPAAPGAGNTASTQARSGAGITVSEQLGGVGSYTSTLRCVRTGTTTEVTGSSDGTFPMPNYPVTCTYTNTRTANELKLEKVWGANSVANDTAALTIAGGVTNPATATSIAPAAPGAGNTASTQARSGAGITVSEQLGGVGSYTSTLRCVRTGTTTEVTGSSDGTFPMPNYPVTCTYTNTRTANELKLEKVWGANSVANDTAALTIAGGVTNPATATSIARPRRARGTPRRPRHVPGPVSRCPSSWAGSGRTPRRCVVCVPARRPR